MLAAVIAALILTQVQAPVYETSITLLMGRAATEAIKTPNALNQIVANDMVLKQIIADEGLDDSIAGLRPRIRAENIPGTALVQINVTDARPLTAKKIADATAARFVQNIKRFDSADKILKYQRQRLKRVRVLQERTSKELRLAKEEIERLESSGSSESNAILMLSLTQRTSSLDGTFINLMQQEAGLLTEIRQTNPTKLIAPAVRPAAPISPDLKKNLTVAAVAALLAGCALAVAAGPARKETSH